MTPLVPVSPARKVVLGLAFFALFAAMFGSEGEGFGVASVAAYGTFGVLSVVMMNPGVSVADCRAWAARRVEAINHALRGIPPESVRFHTCYSIDVGPRVHDMELKDIVEVLFKIKAGAFSFEAANPRHEHEYHVFEAFTPPAGMILIPGVISHTTNLVEHPELIAERIVRFARIVGRENVIAGADCGFAASGIRFNDVHPTVVWLKFAALAEGARLATRQLWARS